MSNSVKDWERRLRFELARSSGWERPAVIRKALSEARPLAAYKATILDVAYDLAREYGITDAQMRSATKSSRPSSSGFFQNLPSDDGPRAA